MTELPTIPVPRDPMIPEEFGDYLRLDSGKSGGMGTVYKVLNRRLNAERALKVLKPELAATPKMRDAFIREAGFGAQLGHGLHILPVHSVGQFQGYYYFEMDWVEGRTLAELIAEEMERESPRLGAWVALAVGEMVLSALSFAHHATIRGKTGETFKGLIHRDIKPGNVLISTRGDLFLTDFGIARARDAKKMTGFGTGTINYMSPEQFAVEQITERSDIYQVGVLMYECVTGRMAFPGEGESGVGRRVARGKFQPIEQCVPDIDRRVKRIILRAMKTEPDERYPSADEMHDDIQACREQMYVPHVLDSAFQRYVHRRVVPHLIDTSPPRHVLRDVLVAVSLLVFLFAAVWYVKTRIDKRALARARDQHDQAVEEYKEQKQLWEEQTWNPPSWRDSVLRAEREFLSRSPETVNQLNLARQEIRRWAGLLHDSVAFLVQGQQSAWMDFNGRLNVYNRNGPPTEDSLRFATLRDSLFGGLSRGDFRRRVVFIREQINLLNEHIESKHSSFTKKANALRGFIDCAISRGAAADSPDVIQARQSVRDYETQENYVAGIAWIGQQIPHFRKTCKDNIHSISPSTLPRVVHKLIDTAKAALNDFKSESEWSSHALVESVSIPDLEMGISRAQHLIKNRDWDGAKMNAESVLQGIAKLYGVWAEEIVDALEACQEKRNDVVTNWTDIRERLSQLHNYEQQPWRQLRDLFRDARGRLEYCHSPLPPTDSLQYERGRRHYLSGDYRESIRLLRSVTDRRFRKYAQLYLAHSRAAIGLFDDVTLKAYRNAGNVIYNDIDFPLVLSNEAQCFLSNGMCDSVESRYERFRRKDTFADAYKNILYAYLACCYRQWQGGDDDQKAGWSRKFGVGLAEFLALFPDDNRLGELRAEEETIARYNKD